MFTRKNFIHLASMSIGGLAIPNLLLSNPTSPGTTQQNSAMKALAQQALEVARSGGASYADVRICSRPKLSISTRVLVNGAWGFASAAAATTEAAYQCVSNALAVATEGNQPAGKTSRHQYDLKTPHDVWVCTVLRK